MTRRPYFFLPVFMGLGLVAFGACGGDTVESDNGGGGTGGQIIDTGTPDSVGDVNTEAAPDSGPDVVEDVSVDTAPDQSIDTGPVDAEVLEGSLFDMTMPDVLLNDAGATLQGCYDCAVSSCTSEMAACEEDDKCRTILLCLFEDQCFGGPNGLDYQCGTGCVLSAGVTGTDDPAVPIALAAGQCIADSCPDDCGMVDGGLPFDGGMPDGN